MGSIKHKNIDIYKHIKEGKFDKAFFLAEEQYNTSNQNASDLENYLAVIFSIVNILFDIPSPDTSRQYYRKAESLILESNIDYKSNENLLLYLLEIYRYDGNIDKIKEIKSYFKNYTDSDTELMNVIEISRKDDRSLDIDEEYLKNQLLEFITYLLSKYFEDNRELKKIYLIIKNDDPIDGYYRLKEFADNQKDNFIKNIIYAELALADKKYTVAKDLYKSLLEGSEDKWMIYNRLGDIESINKNSILALNYYKKAHLLNPSDDNTNIDIVRTHMINGDITKAKAFYLKLSKNKNLDKEKLKKLKSMIAPKKKGNIINGLAGIGGDEIVLGNILEIQFKSSKSNQFSINPIGNVGLSIYESIQKAKIVTEDHFREEILREISINIPGHLVHVCGPSAGSAFTIGMISEISKKKVDNKYAFTGEIDIYGNILRVGGIVDKLTSAYINGIKAVFIPNDNFNDLRYLDPKLKSTLTITPVAHYKEIMEQIWN